MKQRERNHLLRDLSKLQAISIVNTPNFHDFFLPCKVGGAAHTEKKLNPRKVK